MIATTLLPGRHGLHKRVKRVLNIGALVFFPHGPTEKLQSAEPTSGGPGSLRRFAEVQGVSIHHDPHFPTTAS